MLNISPWHIWPVFLMRVPRVNEAWKCHLFPRDIIFISKKLNTKTLIWLTQKTVVLWSPMPIGNRNLFGEQRWSQPCSSSFSQTHEIGKCWHYSQLCIPIYLQFSSLFALTHVSKYEIKNQGKDEDCISRLHALVGVGARFGKYALVLLW